MRPAHCTSPHGHRSTEAAVFKNICNIKQDQSLHISLMWNNYRRNSKILSLLEFLCNFETNSLLYYLGSDWERPRPPTLFIKIGVSLKNVVGPTLLRPKTSCAPGSGPSIKETLKCLQDKTATSTSWTSLAAELRDKQHFSKSTMNQKYYEIFVVDSVNNG